MCDALQIQLKYHTPDEKGETRAERNERFDQVTGPLLVIPEAGEYLWNWFWDIRNSLRQVLDGAAIPIPPSEFIAWAELTGQVVWPSEYAILRAMDKVFCSETNTLIKEDWERRNPPKT